MDLLQGFSSPFWLLSPGERRSLSARGRHPRFLCSYETILPAASGRIMYVRCHSDETWKSDGHVPCRYFVAYVFDTTLGMALAVAIHKGFLRICTALAAAAPHNPTKLWQLIVDCGNYGLPQPLHEMNGWMSSWLCTALLMDGNSWASGQSGRALWASLAQVHRHDGSHFCCSWRSGLSQSFCPDSSAARWYAFQHTSICMAQTSACHIMAGKCT